MHQVSVHTPRTLRCHRKWNTLLLKLITILLNYIDSAETMVAVGHYLLLPIVFSFMAHAFFYIGGHICTALVMEWHLCHIEDSLITTVWTHSRINYNSKFTITIFKCWILLKPVLEGVDGTQAQSNRVCNILQFCCFGLSLGVLFFSVFLLRTLL